MFPDNRCIASPWCCYTYFPVYLKEHYRTLPRILPSNRLQLVDVSVVVHPYRFEITVIEFVDLFDGGHADFLEVGHKHGQSVVNEPLV